VLAKAVEHVVTGAWASSYKRFALRRSKQYVNAGNAPDISRDLTCFTRHAVLEHQHDLDGGIDEKHRDGLGVVA